MAENNRKTVRHFAPVHRLKRRLERSPATFVSSEENLVPRTLAESSSMTNVQVALEDQAYAEELRRLLAEEGKHRIYVVDQPSPSIDGVVFIDENRIGHVAGRTDAARYIVVRGKASGDLDQLWDAGIRCLLPADCSPPIALAVIIDVGIRLRSGSAPRLTE